MGWGVLGYLELEKTHLISLPLTFPRLFPFSLTFPWPLLNSLTFPGFPGEWSPWARYSDALLYVKWHLVALRWSVIKSSSSTLHSLTYLTQTRHNYIKQRDMLNVNTNLTDIITLNRKKFNSQHDFCLSSQIRQSCSARDALRSWWMPGIPSDIGSLCFIV